MSDIVEKLRGYARDDHERGCQGREYHCSCGYDGKRDTLLVEAADKIERLRAALEEIISFQVFGFAITAPEGGDVWCEGTNRFIREEAMVKVRKIARTALGGDND